MRFITGDEVGLLKITTFVNAVPEANKRVRNTSKKPLAPATQATTTVFGKLDRKAAIAMICKSSKKDHVCVARANGLVDDISVETGDVASSWPVFSPQLDRNGNVLISKHKKAEHFIGLAQGAGLLITCTDLGVVRYMHTGDEVAVLSSYLGHS